jgi:hypothetical protein
MKIIKATKFAIDRLEKRIDPGKLRPNWSDRAINHVAL